MRRALRDGEAAAAGDAVSVLGAPDGGGCSAEGSDEAAGFGVPGVDGNGVIYGVRVLGSVVIEGR